MKTQLRKLMVAVAAILTLAVFLSACKKDDNEELNGVSKIQVIHSAEGTGAVDLYANDTKLNTSPVAYTETSGYIQIGTGAKIAQVRLAGSAQVVNSTNINFEDGKSYTIYVTGSGSSDNSVVTDDNTSTPSAGQAKVRFVNLSSLLSATTLTLDNVSSLNSSLAFGTTSDFNLISAGVHNFKATSTTNSSVSANSDFTLQSGKVYTIYLTGTTSLDIGIVANN